MTISKTEAAEIRKARQSAVTELRSIADGAAGREFTDYEKSRVDALERQIADHDSKLDAYFDGSGDGRFDPRVMATATATASYGRALPHGASFRSLPGAGGADVADLGTHLKAIVEGRAQNEGTGGAGAFLVPSPLAASVLDAVAAQMRTREAGAAIVPMDSQTLSQPTVDALPTPSWRAEGAAIGESSATFGNVQFTARSLAVVVKATTEALDDAPMLGATVQSALGQAFAVEMDRVGLLGSGTAPEPKGLLATLPADHITELGTGNGGDATYAEISDAVAAVRGRAYEPSAVILASRTDKAVRTVTGSDGHFVAAPSYLDGIAWLPSAAVPTNVIVGTTTDTATAYVGQFEYLAYGLRTAFTVRPLVERYADEGMVGFLAVARLDVAVLRPDGFQVVTGITN